MSTPIIPIAISPIDRVPGTITLDATNPDGSPATPQVVSVAALPFQQKPSAATVWTAASYNNGKVPVVLTGYAATAQPTDLVIPDPGGDVYAKDADSGYVQAVQVGSVYIA